MGQIEMKVFVRPTSSAAGGCGDGSGHCQVWESLGKEYLKAQLARDIAAL